MNATELSDLARIKQGARATWAAGDFPAVARLTLWEVGPRIVAAVGVQPGERTLDVACGTGNAAIRAAQAGAQVTGVDLTPELFDAARAEAAQAGVTVDWVQGDAEDLPFEDEAFDVVLSTFGCMFAPRHAIAASEIARVLRPGGRIGITSWTPEGGMAASSARLAGTCLLLRRSPSRRRCGATRITCASCSLSRALSWSSAAEPWSSRSSTRLTRRSNTCRRALVP
jgi:SAM-dependent methyltransferase